MFRRMQDQLQWRADLLMAARFEDLSRQFRYPMAIYVNNMPVVILSAEVMIGKATLLHAAMRTRGVHRCVSTVTALEMPRDGRFRVWARWDEHATDPAQTRHSSLIHYLRNTGQGYLSEMVDMQRLGAVTRHEDARPARRLA